ncbi:hypothetical protein MBLNU459_g7522t1 [Dothideomycetes sp. NU459]
MATATETKPKVTLYWLDQSRSQRLVWLLEECNIPYDIEVFKRQPNMRAPPELKKIHPLGKSPVIGVHRESSSEPLILAESGFISEYLTEHWATHLIPEKYAAGKSGPGEETESWLRYKFYMHYAEGSLMSILVTKLIFKSRFCVSLYDSAYEYMLTGVSTTTVLTGAQIPFFLRPITRMICDKVDEGYFNPNLKTHFSFLESQLASSPDNGEFLCGSKLTAADILMSFPVMSAKVVGYITKEAYPKLYAYVERLEGMEGQKKSAKKIEEVTGEPLKTTVDSSKL